MLCDTKLVKNGRTAAGSQRWKCRHCGASSSRTRSDVTRRAQLDQFLTWLLGKHSQTEISSGSTGRTFRHRTRWCWELRPSIPVTGEFYDVVEIDGFNLRSGWCILTARSGGNVIAYQWCARESQAAWGALFQRLPEPAVVVCDGGPGIHAALREHWPNTRVQRCLVHLQRNVRKYVTTRSKTTAGKALWGLTLTLTRVKTTNDAETWTRLLLAWEAEFLHLTKERTYRKYTTEVPSWARPGQTWWYTHQRLRSGHQALHRVIRSGHLFTFLDPQLACLQVPSSTNGIEGGTNSQMRLLLLHHRGMPETHQRRAIEWWLYLHSERPDPIRILAEHQYRPTRIVRPELSDPDPGPALYDTALSAEEGLWLRQGRAGRR